MGIIDFFKNAGRKLGILDDEEETEAVEETAEVSEEERQAKAAEMVQALKAAVAENNITIDNFEVNFVDGLATLTGQVESQSDREKAVLVVGNTFGVGQVDDQLEVVNKEPPSAYHTVQKGDTLSQVSKDVYGVIHMYDVIFEANQPMLNHPDEIFPGQVLRIPTDPPAPIHTVESGDTLGKIAKHYYGEAGRYKDIFEANQDKLSSPDSVDVGQELTIPLLKRPDPAIA